MRLLVASSLGLHCLWPGTDRIETIVSERGCCGLCEMSGTQYATICYQKGLKAQLLLFSPLRGPLGFLDLPDSQLTFLDLFFDSQSSQFFVANTSRDCIDVFQFASSAIRFSHSLVFRRSHADEKDFCHLNSVSVNDSIVYASAWQWCEMGRPVNSESDSPAAEKGVSVRSYRKIPPGEAQGVIFFFDEQGRPTKLLDRLTRPCSLHIQGSILSFCNPWKSQFLVAEFHPKQFGGWHRIKTRFHLGIPGSLSASASIEGTDDWFLASSAIKPKKRYSQIVRVHQWDVVQEMDFPAKLIHNLLVLP